MQLQPNEIRDIIRLLEAGKPLPDKYRFLLFGDNRQVELVWNGKTDEVTTVILPFQTIEHIDEPRSEKEVKLQQDLFDTSGRQTKGWTNKLIWGDNKLILSSLKNGPMRKEIEAQGGIKLIYIDPPFDVGADFSMNIEIGGEEFTKKPSIIEEIAYRDTWGKGADSFITMLYERLKLMYDLLAEDGSIYVHCDWRVNGVIKLILDEVFGKDKQKREIIWSKGNLFGFAVAVEQNYIHSHDTVLFYSKSNNPIFNKQYEPYSEDYIKKRFTKDDKDGMGPYRLQGKNQKQYLIGSKGISLSDVWNLPIENVMSLNQTGYPTQKPEAMLNTIIKVSSNEGDLIADFFCGSGTALSVAEKLGRKWVGVDVGRFGVHTSRKRLIGVQRELKKAGKAYRAFEILNLGKYERKQFVNVENDLRAEEKEEIRKKKEEDFKNLILSAYKAEPLSGFRSFVGKKRDRLVAVGPIEYPVSFSFIESIVQECKEKGITKADVLGFGWEMGLDYEAAKKNGIDLLFKTIPNEVFDKRAVEKGQVKFFDVAYIEAKPIVGKSGQKKSTLAIELTNFTVFYNQDDLAEIEENLKGGQSKVVLENGNLIKVTKDKDSEIVTREVLTGKWTDWIDYWAIDFNFESKKEIIRTLKQSTGAAARLDGTIDPTQSALPKYDEEWTGQYVFENEWQSFRTRKNRDLELTSVAVECMSGRRRVAIKVVDIFGNDTTKVIDVIV